MAIWSASLTAGGRAGEDRRGRRAGDLRHGQSLAYIKDQSGLDRAPRLAAKASPSSCSSTAARTANSSGRRTATRLAFVSDRGDHAFIGVFSAKDRPILYLAPSTGRDGSPRWSPDGTPDRLHAPAGRRRAAANRCCSRRAAAVVDLGRRRRDGRGPCCVWQSPKTLEGSYPGGRRARPTWTGRPATGWCSWPRPTTGRISIRSRRPAARRCC